MLVMVTKIIDNGALENVLIAIMNYQSGVQVDLETSTTYATLY